MERWITGQDILARWKAQPFELVAAMLSGELVAVDEYGNPFTREVDQCFFCCKEISDHKPTVCYVSDDWAEVHCHSISYFSSGQERTKARFSGLKDHVFFMPEVEAYEQAHGLGPLPHKPETAEALAETLRAAGITDAGMIARMVKAAFPETKQVELGLLLAGGERAKDMSPEAAIKTAQRAMKAK